MDNIKYPIGKFILHNEPNADERRKLISGIQILPEKLRVAVCDLTGHQLDIPYREGGWTVRQIVHHLADSHLNGYIRFKWALTEVRPDVKIYHQDPWAETPESISAPPLISVNLLEALHERWVLLLKELTENDFTRIYVHPETGPMKLSEALALYEWHGRHHVAQIQSFRDRMKWI